MTSTIAANAAECHLHWQCPVCVLFISSVALRIVPTTSGPTPDRERAPERFSRQGPRGAQRQSLSWLWSPFLVDCCCSQSALHRLWLTH